MSTTPLDELIEEAAMIWLRERDQQPCSIRRQCLMLMIYEVAGRPLPERPPHPAASPAQRRPAVDVRMRQANDHTLEPDQN